MYPDSDELDDALMGIQIATDLTHAQEAGIEWRQRYVDARCANETLQAALGRHVRRWRKALWFMGAQMTLIVGLLVAVWRLWR